MPRMTDCSEQHRESFEDVLSNLGIASILVDTQVLIRIEQAIRRDTSLRELLQPALENVTQINQVMQRAQLLIGDLWRENNEKGWSDENQ